MITSFKLWDYSATPRAGSDIIRVGEQWLLGTKFGYPIIFAQISCLCNVIVWLWIGFIAWLWFFQCFKCMQQKHPKLTNIVSSSIARNFTLLFKDAIIWTGEFVLFCENPQFTATTMKSLVPSSVIILPKIVWNVGMHAVLDCAKMREICVI